NKTWRMYTTHYGLSLESRKEKNPREEESDSQPPGCFSRQWSKGVVVWLLLFRLNLLSSTMRGHFSSPLLELLFPLTRIETNNFSTAHPFVPSHNMLQLVQIHNMHTCTHEKERTRGEGSP